MLGKRISDPAGIEGGGEIDSMGLLDFTTVFSQEKTRSRTEGVFSGVEGMFSCLNGLRYSGYEIHMGQSDDSGTVLHKGNVYGSYVHGIFDEDGIAQSVVHALYDRRGLGFDEDSEFDVRSYRESQYDQLAKAVRASLDMDLVYRILEEGV